MNYSSLQQLKNIKLPHKRFNALDMAEIDNFRECFKYFKHKNKPEDLSGVIDFESDNLSDLVIPNIHKERKEIGDSCMSCIDFGLLPHNNWQIYGLKGFNGFIFIKNPFTPNGQQNWIRKCLEVYARKPSITNLDRHYKFIDDVWSLQGESDPLKQKLIEKLTWATLGYHYNWDAKVYDRANHSAFPECLAYLAQHICSCLDFETFKPEAAIVNYYNTKSTLGIHCDQSEDHLEEPILSFSFGQSAIFLLGTNLKTEKPVPMFLRSGDIVILSGSCRTSYHAVPSIIQEAVYKRYCVLGNDKVWQPFHKYIEKHRINVSVRQVYQINKTGPPK